MLVEPDHELLLADLGRINSELNTQRRVTVEVASELETPTQLVLGLAELLLEDHSHNLSVRTRLEQLERTARTLKSLVADLRRGLGLPQDEHYRLESTDVGPWVASVVDRTRLVSHTKGTTLGLVAELSGPTHVRLDTDRLERALSHLLGNAVKYSPSGSQVVLHVFRSDRDVVVEVKDQGPGVAPDARRRIFEVFQREPETDDSPGLGLGLHIAREIVRAHGGEIDVGSATGDGAVFSMRLPAVETDGNTDGSPS